MVHFMEEISDIAKRAEALFAAVLAGLCYVDFYAKDKKKDALAAKEKERIFSRNREAAKRRLFLDSVNKKCHRYHSCPLTLVKPHNYKSFMAAMHDELEEVLGSDGLSYAFWLDVESGYIPVKVQESWCLPDDYFALLATCVYERYASSHYVRDALKEVARGIGVKNSEKLSHSTLWRQRRRRAAECVFTAVLVCVLAAGAFFAWQSIAYYKEEKSFKSFDLKNLAQKDFIFQSIAFRKFLVYGTTGGSDLTDELQIYYVAGEATLSFSDVDSLSIDTDRSDYAKKILRLNYAPADSRKMPFDIAVLINENDIYPVADYESQKFLGAFDLVPRDKNEAMMIQQAKERLKTEFEEQLLSDMEKGSLSESDTYQAFLKKFTEMVRNASDWETVEIDFGRGQ